MTSERDREEISKNDAIMLLYQAIDKIYRESPTSKGEYVKPTAYFCLVKVLNGYLAPAIIAQYGQQHFDTFESRQTVQAMENTWKHCYNHFLNDWN